MQGAVAMNEVQAKSTSVFSSAVRKGRRRARRWADQFMVAVRYGTTRPEQVRLADGRTELFVDPCDERVYRLLVLRSWRPHYSRVQAFWRAAASEYRPSCVVDVGVNAGECLFGTSYPPEARVFGFEANPRLETLLRRNLARHPNRERIRLVSGVASDTTGQTVTFYIDRLWSGKSSAVPGLATDARRVEEVSLATTTVDDVLQRSDAALDRVLFKIDVEGHERAVLRGMTRSFERARSAVGLVEFDVAYLRRARVEPAAFLRELQERFRVLAFVEDEKVVEVGDMGLDGLSALVRDDPCHTDLVLIAGDDAERFAAQLEQWPTLVRHEGA